MPNPPESEVCQYKPDASGWPGSPSAVSSVSSIVWYQVDMAVPPASIPPTCAPAPPPSAPPAPPDVPANALFAPPSPLLVALTSRERPPQAESATMHSQHWGFRLATLTTTTVMSRCARPAQSQTLPLRILWHVGARPRALPRRCTGIRRSSLCEPADRQRQTKEDSRPKPAPLARLGLTFRTTHRASPFARDTVEITSSRACHPLGAQRRPRH